MYNRDYMDLQSYKIKYYNSITNNIVAPQLILVPITTTTIAITITTTTTSIIATTTTTTSNEGDI